MKRAARQKKHIKIRKIVAGTNQRSRLAIFRSNKYIYAQLIDDQKGVTLAAESDLKIKEGNKKERAFVIGKKLAQKALKQQIKTIVFDRGGFLYHGRVAEVARGAREGGLKF